MGSRLLQRFLQFTPRILHRHCRFLTTKTHHLSYYRCSGIIQQHHCRWPTSHQAYCTAASPQLQCMNIQDSQDFQERVLASEIPVVVDFHATWCGPCKLLGPRLEAIVASKGGKVHIAKIDIDENTELAMEYGVQSVPSVYGIKNGKVQDTFIGLIDDDRIDTFVEKLIN